MHRMRLDGVVALFGVRQAIFVGWVHYLVFDLFVGAWIARDAGRLGRCPLHRRGAGPE